MPGSNICSVHSRYGRQTVKVAVQYCRAGISAKNRAASHHRVSRGPIVYIPVARAFPDPIPPRVLWVGLPVAIGIRPPSPGLRTRRIRRSRRSPRVRRDHDRGLGSAVAPDGWRSGQWRWRRLPGLGRDG